MLQRRLESILNQDYPRTEIFVLDNGSDEPLTEEFQSRYPRTEVYINKKTRDLKPAIIFYFPKHWIANGLP